jgi:uracil-DNA glycosylase
VAPCALRQAAAPERPTRADVGACLPCVETELKLVRPDALVLLGATAAQALLGQDIRVTRDHWVWSQIFDWRRSAQAFPDPERTLAGTAPRGSLRHVAIQPKSSPMMPASTTHPIHRCGDQSSRPSVAIATK